MQKSVQKNRNELLSKIFSGKLTGKINGCFLGKTSLAKNFQIIFMGVGGGGGGTPTLLEDQCSTGKKYQKEMNVWSG